MAKPPTAQPTPASAPGAPRWTYAVAALIPLAALAWAVVSHFVPKAEPTRAAPAAVAPTTSQPGGAVAVEIGGSGNVGIGVMSGGQVNVATPPTAPASPASVHGAAVAR